MTPTLYKCNRAANAIALNPLLLLQKIVPKILKCRNFRGNQSEREGSACHADKIRVYADADRIMEVESQLEEIAPRTELKYASKACVVL